MARVKRGTTTKARHKRLIFVSIAIVGVAIAAAVAADLPVAEYAAKRVKLAVVGTGRAGKDQVQHMVAAMLQLTAHVQLGSDSADALAIAICHVNTSVP